MQYFDKDFIQFFKELENNNNKEWFDENRKRYEKIIKDPFKAFVSDLIRFVSSEDPETRVEPKDCIFRINKDIRFSKDKTPYKIGVSCSISPGGRKNMITPGLYVELNANEVRVYSGVYKPGKEDLLKIRRHISNNLPELKRLSSSKVFKENFNEILGEKNKVIPKEFKELAEKEEIIKHKQFYFYKTHSSSLIPTDTLFAQITEDYKALKPMMMFLREALL